SSETVRAAGHDVMDAMLDDFLRVGEASIGDHASRPELEKLLREPPPEQGIGLTHLLDEFQTKIAPHAFRVTHPRFWAFVPSAPSFASILGECLATSTNFFAGVW